MLRSGATFIDVANGGVLQTEAGLANLLPPKATGTHVDDASGPSETISVAAMSLRGTAPVAHPQRTGGDAEPAAAHRWSRTQTSFNGSR